MEQIAPERPSKAIEDALEPNEQIQAETLAQYPPNLWFAALAYVVAAPVVIPLLLATLILRLIVAALRRAPPELLWLVAWLLWALLPGSYRSTSPQRRPRSRPQRRTRVLCPGYCYVVVTDRRILFFSVWIPTVRPKRLLWADLRSECRRVKIIDPDRLTFGYRHNERRIYRLRVAPVSRDQGDALLAALNPD
jgi:hypothetical protein